MKSRGSMWFEPIDEKEYPEELWWVASHADCWHKNRLFSREIDAWAFIAEQHDGEDWRIESRWIERRGEETDGMLEEDYDDN